MIAEPYWVVNSQTDWFGPYESLVQAQADEVVMAIEWAAIWERARRESMSADMTESARKRVQQILSSKIHVKLHKQERPPLGATMYAAHEMWELMRGLS